MEAIPAVDEEKAVALSKEIEPILTTAKLFEVVSLPSYEEAMRLGALCAEYSTKWTALYAEGRDMAHRLHKWFTGRIAEKVTPLEAAKTQFANKARAWRRAEDEKARRAEAERQAAERARIEEERLIQATALAARGKTALADAVLEKPVEVESVHYAQVAQPAGTSDREAWTYEIVEVEKIPREYLMPDLVKIGKMVRALKAGCRIEGIRVYDKGATAFSRK